MAHARSLGVRHFFCHNPRMNRLATNNIFLVGPMGAGKTTIGKRLAKQLKLDFIDSDREIEARTGVDIPYIFDLEGEAGFRRRESAMIDELTQRNGVVLATGGGAVLDLENRKRLRSRGTVLYLFCTVDQQHDRTAKSKNRPLLQTEDPRARLQALFEQRDPLYREVADFIIETNHKGINTVVDEIIRRISEQMHI